MKISKWAAGSLCAGATLLSFVVAEAQQFAPRARVQSGIPSGRVQAGAYPAGQPYNPGVQARPGAPYSSDRTVQPSGRQWQTQAGSLDADIAAQLALGNAEEIAMSRLGAERAESDEVREFAEMMVQQHSDFLSRLNRVQPQIVAAYGRLSGSRTAAWEDDRYERRTTRRVGEEGYERRDGASGRFDDDSRRDSRGRSSDLDDEGGLRGGRSGSNRVDADDSEADFRSDRSRAESSDRTGTGRTGTQRTGSGRIGNSTDQPTGGDEDSGPTGTNNNQTGTAGPSGTGAGSTGGVGTRTGAGRAETSGSSGANTGGASGIGTGASGTSGAGASGSGSTGGAGGGSSGAGASGAGAGGAGGAGAGSGGAGAGGAGGGAGGSGGSGASLQPSMKTYPVVFQAGSADENEDRQVPNRRRSGDVEEEGTTIGENQTEPRGGYNQESTTQDGGGARSSRDAASRSGQSSYDEDDYRDTRRGTSPPRSSRYADEDSADYGQSRSSAGQRSTRSYGDDYGRETRATQRGVYSEEYDARPATTARTQRGAMPTSIVQSPHLQLQRDVTERCLAHAQRELEGKEGAEFDMAFMGMQIVAHNRMLATLEAAREHASPQLARLIDEGIESAEQHLDHAREIVENLQRDQNRTSGRERSSRQ